MEVKTSFDASWTAEKTWPSLFILSPWGRVRHFHFLMPACGGNRVSVTTKKSVFSSSVISVEEKTDYINKCPYTLYVHTVGILTLLALCARELPHSRLFLGLHINMPTRRFTHPPSPSTLAHLNITVSR